MADSTTAHRRRDIRKLSISETICESIAHAAQDLDMRAIAVYTETGTTARLISKYRPNAEIFGFSYIPGVCNRMNLLWGLHPVVVEHPPAVEDMVSGAEHQLLKAAVASPGDVIGIVAGTRTTSGSTNFMRLHMIGSGDDLQAGKSAHNRVMADKRKKTLNSKNGRKRLSVKA